jgi:aminoglycoside phosphotransferase (APT) family kinase protein
MLVVRQPLAVFTRRSTLDLLRAACGLVGLDPQGAELIRLGQNAIYGLSSAPVVVRIARGADYMAEATKEVAVAGWLNASGVSAARTWPVEQPIDVDGHPVTFWHYIDGRRGAPRDVRTLGAILRAIHALARPDTFVLPAQHPLQRVSGRVEAADLAPADRQYLVEVIDELTDALAGLDYPLPEAVNHGDAHVQNLMFVGNQPQILDFEGVCWGHPEWDLITTATEYVTAGFWTADQYRDFVDAYGFDITKWSGFDVMRRVRELTMTTWLMQNVNESPEIRAEFEKRMGTIRAGHPTEPWQAF